MARCRTRAEPRTRTHVTLDEGARIARRRPRDVRVRGPLPSPGERRTVRARTAWSLLDCAADLPQVLAERVRRIVDAAEQVLIERSLRTQRLAGGILNACSRSACQIARAASSTSSTRPAGTKATPSSSANTTSSLVMTCSPKRALESASGSCRSSRTGPAGQFP